MSAIEGHCVKFLKALSNIGGPVADAAEMIQEKWREAVRDEAGEIHFDYA